MDAVARMLRIRRMVRAGLLSDHTCQFAQHERSMLILLRHEYLQGLNPEVRERRQSLLGRLVPWTK